MFGTECYIHFSNNLCIYCTVTCHRQCIDLICHNYYPAIPCHMYSLAKCYSYKGGECSVDLRGKITSLSGLGMSSIVMNVRI
jgi:hypothetical protein